MHGAENFVEQRKIVRRFFQFQQIRLYGLKVLFGFNDEIRKQFRIHEILAHTIFPYGLALQPGAGFLLREPA
jgi:hypothetical protein